MLRHFRSPHSNEDTASYRERIARTIATLFDETVDDGPPQGAVDVIVSALAKAAKSGLRPDPSLPDKTRGISLHNTLAKLHDIIIDVRFIHAIVTNTIVSATQAGFMPGRSTEQCAFSLFETVRARWREGLDTWVLFVDFWKAYDNVSPSAMWRILELIGFPQRIISYLRSCYEQRKTRFSYNGNVVDSFEQLLGLCQGGVLSCLFFNLFIESLSRYLAVTEKLRGVKVTTPGGTFTVLSKFFADDLKALAATRGQLAQLAEAIVKWCAAHGLKVTVSGTDKTAAMHFAVNTPAVLPTDLVVKIGPTELRIPFTRLYIYVGHRVTDSLNPIVTQDDIVAKVRASFAAFAANTELRAASLALQRSFLLSTVVGAPSNLLAMAPPGAAFEKRIDSVIRSAIANIYRTTPAGMCLTDLRIPPTAALLARAYERFRLSMLVNDVPEAALLGVTHADPILPTSLRAQRMTRTRSWVASYYSILRRYGFDPTWTMNLTAGQAHPWDISSRAHALSSRVAYTAWYDDAQAYLTARAAQEANKPIVTTRALPPKLNALLAGSVEPWNAPHLALTRVAGDDLPQQARYRAAALGSGSGAPIFSYTRLGPYKFILVRAARLGRLALFSRPLWKPPPPPPKTPAIIFPRGTPRNVRKAGRDAAKETAKAALAGVNASRMAAIYRRTACNLCDALRGDLIHICTACPATAARRGSTLGNGLLAAMLRSITGAAYLSRRTRPPQTLVDDINALALNSPETTFIITRIINSAPWPAAAAAPGWTVVARLGLLFERAVPQHYAAPLSDAWVTAAHAIVSGIGLRWWTLLPAPARAALENAGFIIPE